MKKIKYYIYYSYKDNLYHIFNRNDFFENSFYTFKGLFDYINEQNIPYENCRLKSMTLREFLEYATFRKE